jgi:hypothetical protein
LQDQSQSSYSWLRSAFYLKWGPAHDPLASADPTTGSSLSENPDSDSPVTSIDTTQSHAVDKSSERKCVTLICFSPPSQLIDRFKRLLRNKEWRNVLENPFDLWIVVIDELFALMDAQAWNLADVFRGIERVSQKYMHIFPRYEIMRVPSAQSTVYGC